MKNTALTHIHESLGAKMLPFAGYNMPILYEGVNAEHETVRNAVGVFDVSHMGEFLLTGPNALALIQKVCSNDASTLTIGKAQYSCLPNNDGGIVDDLIIYKMKDEQYLLVVNASNIDKDWDWISTHNDLDVDMRNLSEDYSLLAIQGPKAVEAMQSLTSIDLSAIPNYHFEVGDFAGIENVIISATGYTGSGGFEIYCKNSEVGIKYLKRVRLLALNQLVLRHVTLYVLKWVSVYMEMTLAIQLHHLKLDWVGLLNSTKNSPILRI